MFLCEIPGTWFVFRHRLSLTQPFFRRPNIVGEMPERVYRKFNELIKRTDYVCPPRIYEVWTNFLQRSAWRKRWIHVKKSDGKIWKKCWKYTYWNHDAKCWSSYGHDVTRFSYVMGQNWYLSLSVVLLVSAHTQTQAKRHGDCMKPTWLGWMKCWGNIYPAWGCGKWVGVIGPSLHVVLPAVQATTMAVRSIQCCPFNLSPTFVGFFLTFICLSSTVFKSPPEDYDLIKPESMSVRPQFFRSILMKRDMRVEVDE